MTEPHYAQTQHQNPLIRPRLLLRAEGLALLVASVAAYLVVGGHWGYLFLGFLAGLTFIGYYANPRLGAAFYNYNLVHTTFFPLISALFGFFAGSNLALLVGLIMLAHIGLDRTLGYGLKYPDAFKHTHLD